MALAPLSGGFESLPPLPTIKLGPSSADSRVGGLVHTLGPCGSLQRPFPRALEFLPLPPQPPWVFSIRGLRLYFPELEPWLCGLLHSPAVPPGLSIRECGAVGSASCLTACPFPTSCHLAASPFRPAACLRPSYWSG